MTTSAAGASCSQLAREDLTARIFRALYRDFDLYIISGTHVVVPKGTPWLAGPSLGAIARQLSTRQHPDPETGFAQHDLPCRGPGTIP